MHWWQALILGIVEGVTEYLPVSSTGHLILTAWLMGLHHEPGHWKAAFTFNIVIQAGAIAAVLGLYRSRLLHMARGVLGRDKEGKRLAGHLGLAFLPAALLGPLLAEPIEGFLNGPWPVVAALFAGGVLMIAVGSCDRLRVQRGRALNDLDWRMALIIGSSQCVAMWPGTSRSMVTIVAALLLGLHPTAAAEFSFLLGVLTLGAATVFKALQDGPAMLGQFGLGPVLLGFFTASVAAGLAVSWLVRFLNRHGVAPFGWYRLAIAAVFAVLLGFQLLTLPVP
jgi:undecaprenyl-diphosphatase